MESRQFGRYDKEVLQRRNIVNPLRQGRSGVYSLSRMAAFVLGGEMTKAIWEQEHRKMKLYLSKSFSVNILKEDNPHEKTN
jgi:hypothetical protein